MVQSTLEDTENWSQKISLVECWDAWQIEKAAKRLVQWFSKKSLRLVTIFPVNMNKIHSTVLVRGEEIDR